MNSLVTLGLWSSSNRANFSEHFSSTTGKYQTTTPGISCPSLYDECVGSLTSPADHNSEDAGDGAYGLSSLAEKTRMPSNRLQISLQRQHNGLGRVPWVIAGHRKCHDS